MFWLISIIFCSTVELIFILGKDINHYYYYYLISLSNYSFYKAIICCIFWFCREQSGHVWASCSSLFLYVLLMLQLLDFCVRPSVCLFWPRFLLVSSQLRSWIHPHICRWSESQILLWGTGMPGLDNPSGEDTCDRVTGHPHHDNYHCRGPLLSCSWRLSWLQMLSLFLILDNPAMLARDTTDYQAWCAFLLSPGICRMHIPLFFISLDFWIYSQIAF